MNPPSVFLRGALIAVSVLVLVTVISPESQAITVIPVPQNPLDPTVPHAAYNGHPTTLKAIARGCTQATIYFRWDFDGNGTWDPCMGRSTAVMPGYWYADSPYNLDGRTIYPTLDPSQFSSRLYQAIIEVTCTAPPGGIPVTSAFSSCPVLLDPEPPVPESAELATDEQLHWMRLAAEDDALWTLHKSMTRTGSGTSTITGYLSGASGGNREVVTALFILAALARGHRGAYPPGTYNAYGIPTPPGFLEENTLRYAQDPYAEDVIRGVNYLLETTNSITIPATDEADDGTTPIPGTNDATGFYLASDMFDQEIGRLSLPVAAIAASGLAGTAAQISNVRVNGKSFEYIVQQLVDFAAAAQIDATAGGIAMLGGWSWSPCFGCTSSQAVSYMDSHWILALQTAEQKMGISGVYVNQALKGGLANVLVRNQNVDGGPFYFDGYPLVLFEPIGGSIYGCRWLGWDAWDASDPTPTGYPNLPATRGEARTRFDDYMAYAVANWNLVGGTGNYYDATRGIWKDGNPADTTPGYQADVWTMSGSLLRAGLSYSGATPAMSTVGAHDWQREFSMSLIEGEYLYETIGWLYEDPGPSWVNAYLSYAGATGHALLMADFGNASPVATLAPQGCASGSCAGDCCVTTLTNVSFQILATDLDGTVTQILLDFGDGTPPEMVTPGTNPVHRYATAGDYEAIVTVTDDEGATGTDILAVVVADVVPGWANLQWPPTMLLDPEAQSDPIYGQVLLTGVTNAVGQGAGIDAMVGYGPYGTDPAADPAWEWSTAVYNLDVGNNDEYMGTFTGPGEGHYNYCFRFRYSGGPWLYGDLDGSTNGYAPEQAGDLTVSSGGLAVPTWDASFPMRLYAARPNPSTGNARITFDLPTESRLTLEILDSSGRLVRTLIRASSHPAGRHEIRWDGRDTERRAAAPGVYFCRMRAGSLAEAERLVLIR